MIYIYVSRDRERRYDSAKMMRNDVGLQGEAIKKKVTITNLADHLSEIFAIVDGGNQKEDRANNKKNVQNGVLCS